jgi:ribosomal protein L22
MAEEMKKEKVQEQKTEQAEAKKEEVKKEEKKQVKVENKKRNFVTAKGDSLHISPKEAGHTCDMIRNRNVDIAIKWLEEVIAQKRVLKMNNREVPHQHGKGVMAGRFPVNTSQEFIRMLKNLRASALYHEMELEKAKLTECYANVASKPYKRGGARAKRTHVFLKLEMKNKETKKTENKQKENKK